MKEFVITIEYERGVDRVMDVFMEYPETIAKSATCLATKHNMWRLDRITGPADALSTLDDVFLDPTYCNECLDSKRCSKDHQYVTLSRDTMERSIYTYQSIGESCHSIPHLAVNHLGDGILFSLSSMPAADGGTTVPVLNPASVSSTPFVSTTDGFTTVVLGNRLGHRGSPTPRACNCRGTAEAPGSVDPAPGMDSRTHASTA